MSESVNIGGKYYVSGAGVPGGTGGGQASRHAGGKGFIQSVFIGPGPSLPTGGGGGGGADILRTMHSPEARLTTAMFLLNDAFRELQTQRVDTPLLKRISDFLKPRP